MASTAHIDTFAQDRLPPREAWPQFLFNDDTRYPERFNAAAATGSRSAIPMPAAPAGSPPSAMPSWPR